VTSHDLRLFLDFQLSQRKPAHNLSVIQDFRSAVLEGLENADGGFLWVKLVVRELISRFLEQGDLRLLLQALPKSLNEIYEMILTSIAHQSQANAKTTLKLLEFVSFAVQPLTVLEIGYATFLDKEPFSSPPLQQRQIERKIHRLCSSLIEIKQSKVYFIHQSVREFLVSSSPSTLADSHKGSNIYGARANLYSAHEHFTRVCFEYLLFAAFRGELECPKCNIVVKRCCHNKLAVYSGKWNRLPFFEYASKNWYRHWDFIRGKYDDFGIPEFESLVSILSNPKSTSFRAWFPIFWADTCTETWEQKRYPEYPTELIVQAFLGNGREIRNLLEWKKVGIDESTPAGEEWTPLMAAAWMGRASIVDLLLEYQAGYRAGPQQNARTLVTAIERGHVVIAQQLVAHLTRIQSFIWDSSRGLSILDTPVENSGVTALLSAIRGGYTDLSLSLIKSDADVNARAFPHYPTDRSRRFEIDLEFPVTPLGAAVSAGLIDFALLLIELGADVKASNALHNAARYGYLRVISRIINSWCSIDAASHQVYDGWTPLHVAAYHGSIGTVRFLIQAGASVNLKDDFGRKPLSLACGLGHLDVVQVLLDCSTQAAEAIDQAFLTSCVSGSDRVTRYLLDRGADVHAIDPLSGKSALDLLFSEESGSQTRQSSLCDWWVGSIFSHRRSRQSLFGHLVARGADISRVDSFGNTYIHLAASQRWDGLLSWILDNRKSGVLGTGISDIDIDLRNEFGQTPLHYAVLQGSEEFCQALLKLGARVTRPIVVSAIITGNHVLVRRLLEGEHDRYATLSGIFSQYKEFHVSQKDSVNQYSSSPLSKLACRATTNPSTALAKLENTAEFLALRGIEDLAQITMTTEINFSYSNAIKSWIEDCSSTAWIWWPFTPRYKPLVSGEVWLEWVCVSPSAGKACTIR
jgi:ankyrin repeat protein